MTNPSKGDPLTRIASFTVRDPGAIAPHLFHAAMTFAPPGYNTLKFVQALQPTDICPDYPAFARWYAAAVVGHPDRTSLDRSLAYLIAVHTLLRTFFGSMTPADRRSTPPFVSHALTHAKLLRVIDAVHGDPHVRYAMDDADMTVTLYVGFPTREEAEAMVKVVSGAIRKGVIGFERA